MLIESGALIVNVCVVEACMSFERWKLMRVMTRLTEPAKLSRYTGIQERGDEDSDKRGI